MNQDDQIDRVILKTLNQKTKARFKLVKAGEHVLFFKIAKTTKIKDLPGDKPDSKPKPVPDPSSPDPSSIAPYYPRPLVADGAYAKLSLACFQKPLDETLKQFARDELYQTLVCFYEDKMSKEVFYEMLKQVEIQKPQAICQLKFKDEALQKQFFDLLVHPKYPLEHLLCLDHFDKGALFYFNTLQKDLFQALFHASDLDEFFIQEKEIRKANRKKSIVQQQIGPLLAKFAPHWTVSMIDHLMSFQEPDKKAYQVRGEHHEFFYYTKDAGVLLQK